MASNPTWPEGFIVHERDEAGSTNDEARLLAEAGAADGTVVWARRQTAGRGRRGRRWESPAGNLYFSVVMRPGVDAATGAQLSFVAALAIADAIAAFLPEGAPVEQKWPNDVLVGGAKITGILLESSGGAGHSVDWIIAGCGVNVAQAPEAVGVTATSLHREGAADTAVRDVLALVLARLGFWRDAWARDGFAPVRAAWLARARGLGGPVTVRLPSGELQGRFADMDGTGALLLDLPDGSRRHVTAGEVYFGAGAIAAEQR
jgi:BirA family biotin operon repressor/biotin-[acetyl-CoA-carboxylase] ligase